MTFRDREAAWWDARRIMRIRQVRRGRGLPSLLSLPPGLTSDEPGESLGGGEGEKTTCSEASKKDCYAYSYKAKFPTADAAIEAECTRMASASSACGAEIVAAADVAPFCHRNAQMEKSAVVINYACVADASCGADTSACELPKGTLGAEICKKVASCGSECVGETESYLDSMTNWARADVLAAARGCLTQSTCENALACVDAFFTALDYTKN